VAVRLKEENGSGNMGRATLRPGSDGFTVVLRTNPRRLDYHAHIHDVSCADYRRIKDFDAQLATIAEGLRDPAKGKSATDIAKPLASFRTAGYSINVHDLDPTFTVVACGDIPAG